MRLTLIPLAAAALLAAGCGGDSKSLGMATTPEASREALTAALDGWKAGETREALAGRSPPVHLGDDDFTRGYKLQTYKVEGEPKVVGTGLSYVVTLSMLAKDQPATRKVAYRVVTTPQWAVTREDGMP